MAKKNVEDISEKIMNIYEKFERLHFVNRIAVGLLKKQKKFMQIKSPQIKIIGYNEKSKEYYVSIFAGGQILETRLNVDRKNPDYKTQILECI
jgi:hypothetical protein